MSKLPTKTTLCVYNANFESPVINDPTIIFRDVQHKVAAMGLPNSLEKAGQALKQQGRMPFELMTDTLKSYAAAKKEIMPSVNLPS